MRASRRDLCAMMAAALAGAAAPAVAGQRAKKPSIAGHWEHYPPLYTEGDPRYVPPPSEPPPLRPADLAALQARQKAIRDAEDKGEPLFKTREACIPEGFPSMMGAMYPMEVIVTDDQVTILEEAFNQQRRIYLDRPQKAAAEIDPGYYGRSVGHWEGEVLVVQTVGVREDVRFRDVPHSPARLITERLYLVAPDYLHDEIVIRDPVWLTKPWKLWNAYKRRPGYEMMDYVCENNLWDRDPSGKLTYRGPG